MTKACATLPVRRTHELAVISLVICRRPQPRAKQDDWWEALSPAGPVHHITALQVHAGFVDSLGRLPLARFGASVREKPQRLWLSRMALRGAKVGYNIVPAILTKVHMMVSLSTTEEHLKQG